MAPCRIALPPELFAPAESSRFEGSFVVSRMAAGPDVYEFDAPLAWQVDVADTGDELVVRGSVQGEARGVCARCLEEFCFHVNGEVEGCFLLDADKAAPGELDDDEFDVLPANREIDLEPLIKAALLLEFPLVPLCDEYCEGLCARCGANLNEGPCGCDAAPAAEDDGPPSPFSALADFPFDKPERL